MKLFTIFYFMLFRKTLNQVKFKRCLFISGCPRSGTSMLTKIIDSHPDIGVLMEAILKNRRRHSQKAGYWSDQKYFAKEINSLYSNVSEPIIGNKVCNPDVWSLEDIIQFCSLFSRYDIIWIVRNPVDNIRSRYNREPTDHYNEKAKRSLPLDYSNSFNTWASSWRQSIENYTRLKEHTPQNVHLVYYDDLIEDFATQTRLLFDKLSIPFSEAILKWNEMPHYDGKGRKKFNLKYQDEPASKVRNHELLPDIEEKIENSLIANKYWVDRWSTRTI